MPFTLDFHILIHVFGKSSNEPACPHKGLGTSKEPSFRPQINILAREVGGEQITRKKQTSQKTLGEILNYAPSRCGGELPMHNNKSSLG